MKLYYLEIFLMPSYHFVKKIGLEDHVDDLEPHTIKINSH